MTNHFSDPIAQGIAPVNLDFNFTGPRDHLYPFRVNVPGQYFLCPAVGNLPPFVFPLALGYRTDGPSIPWYAQWIVRKDGPAWVPALFHDEGCSGELFPVEIVNEIMVIAMDLSPKPIPRWTKRKIEFAIDKFCAGTWKEHIPEEVASDRRLILNASRELWRTHAPLFAGYAKIEEVSEVLHDEEFLKTALSIENQGGPL